MNELFDSGLFLGGFLMIVRGELAHDCEGGFAHDLRVVFS